VRDKKTSGKNKSNGRGMLSRVVFKNEELSTIMNTYVKNQQELSQNVERHPITF
jgi:hypothetical protein